MGGALALYLLNNASIVLHGLNEEEESFRVAVHLLKLAISMQGVYPFVLSQLRFSLSEVASSSVELNRLASSLRLRAVILEILHLMKAKISYRGLNAAIPSWGHLEKSQPPLHLSEYRVDLADQT